jgi:hypothetical protein
MDSTLSALVALGVVIGLIAIGIRISLHLFSPDAEKSLRFSRRLPLADEPLPSHNIYIVRRPRHPRVRVEDKAYSSSRYAWHSLIAIALFLLLAVVAIVSILSDIMH